MGGSLVGCPPLGLAGSGLEREEGPGLLMDAQTHARMEGRKKCLQASHPFSPLLQALPSIQMPQRPDELFILDFVVAGWLVQFLCSLFKSDLNILFIV